jgi:anti-sigma factor RsiW
MTCRDIIEFLTEYEAGMVTAEERAVFEAHLAICPPCVAYLRTYQATVQFGTAALGGAEEATDPVPEELVAAILAARKGGA